MFDSQKKSFLWSLYIKYRKMVNITYSSIYKNISFVLKNP